MSKLTKSARGRECQVRIPAVCNRNPETVVFAHLSGGGIARKKKDIHGAFCCSSCHDVLDGRVPAPVGLTKDELKLMHHEGKERTEDIWLDEGLIEIKWIGG